MKLFVALIMVHLFSFSTYAEEPVRSWIWDNSQPGTSRMADLWLAAKIVVAGNKVSLLRESNGKLTEYWTADNAKTADIVLQIVGMAPSLLIQVDDGSFVRVTSVTSADVGEKSCTLKIGTVMVGTLTDPQKIETVCNKLGFAHLRGP